MFQESLEKLVKSVDGALGAAVMNRNGVIVEHVLNISDSPGALDGLPEQILVPRVNGKSHT